MRFSSTEIKQIARAWAAISLAFAVLLFKEEPLSIQFIYSLWSLDFLLSFIMSAITVGLGFLLHELAHKFLAQKYGCIAEFRSFDHMLVLAVIMSFFGFILAAPGAVFIHGNINRARNGRISAVGPMVNIALAFVFFALLYLSPLITANAFITSLLFYGLSINGWLALFNLLPFFMLDGTKVLAWNKKIYAGLVILAIISMLLPGLV